jgi:hypothetical protein
MVVDGRNVDARLAAEVADRDRRETSLCKQLLGRIEETLLGGLSVGGHV